MAERRWPFIPPREPVRRHPVRPLTIVELLGDEDGHRYRGVVDGKSVEVFSQPGEGGEVYETGTVHMARVVSGSNELFIPAPYSTVKLFVFPGLTLSDKRSRLYEYVGQELVERWTAPVEGEETYIIWAGHFQGTIMLCTADNTDTEEYGVKLYSLNMVTWEATNLGFAATLNPQTYHGNFFYILDGAEFNDCLYLARVNFWDYTSQVLKYDPGANSLAVADTAPNESPPAIAVFNEERIVWSDGYTVRSSLDGTTFQEDVDFYSLYGSYEQGTMHTNGRDGHAFLAGFRDDGDDYLWVVWETANGTTWNYNDLGHDTLMVCGLGVQYIASGSEPDYIYAALWAWRSTASPAIWRRPAAGGAWVLDWAGPGADWETPQGEALASIGGELFFTVVDTTGQKVRLYKRSDSIWSLVQEWDNQGFAYWNTTNGVGVIRAASSLGCEEA